MIIYSKNNYNRSENEGTITVNTNCLEVSIKPTQIALAALLVLQTSALVISSFYPEQSFTMQTGLLTASFLLFVKVNKTHNTQLNQLTQRAKAANLKKLAPSDPKPAQDTVKLPSEDSQSKSSAVGEEKKPSPLPSHQDVNK